MANIETIRYSDDALVEKIAHEAAMAAAITEFKSAFNSGMINPTHETGYIINLYYQHKDRALIDIMNNYKFKSL